MHKNSDIKVLSSSKITKKIGKSRTTLWRWVKEGYFPAPIILGPNSIGWISSEVDEWISTRPRSK